MELYNIPISKTQQYMLLEMCNNLFPNYSWGFEDCCQAGATDFMFNNLESNPKKSKYEYGDGNYHWFEFCLTHLSTKIYNLGYYHCYNISITEFRGYLIQEAVHPVDYLYEEFQSMKRRNCLTENN